MPYDHDHDGAGENMNPDVTPQWMSLDAMCIKKERKRYNKHQIFIFKIDNQQYV